MYRTMSARRNQEDRRQVVRLSGGRELLERVAFPVEEQKFDINGLDAGRWKAIVRTMPSGERKVLSIVSKGYQVVKYEDVLAPVVLGMEADGWAFKRLDVEGNGRRIAVDIQGTTDHLRQFAELARSGSPVKLDDSPMAPRLTMTNSYDGTTGVHFSLGVIRLVCLNGMVAPSGRQLAFHSSHTGNVNGRMRDFGGGLDSIRRLIPDLGKSFRVFSDWNEKPVTADQAATVCSRTAGARRAYEMHRHFESGEMERNAWGLYNAGTRWLSHDFEGSISLRERKNRNLAEDVAAVFEGKELKAEQE